MWTLVDVFAFVAGFAACWFAKDQIIRFVMGADAFITALEAKAAALKAAL
jgi:hypothetical protein